MPTEPAIVDLLGQQKVLPLFTCRNVATGLAVLEAVQRGVFASSSSPTARPRPSTCSGSWRPRRPRGLGAILAGIG
jgi:hypothetical protein